MFSIRITIVSIAVFYIIWGVFNEKQLPKACLHNSISVIGQISSLSQSNSSKELIKFYFIPNEGPLNNKKILLWWKTSDEQPKLGETWYLNIRLKPSNGWQNANTFDYETYLHSQSISATGYVLNKELNVRLEASKGLIAIQRESLREKLIQRDSSDITGILLALTLGDRSLITQEQWDLFIQTGTNHLLAISGLHITLIAGLIFWLARKGFGFKSSLLISLFFAGLYAAMAGFTIPTQRAWIMLLLFSGMLLSYRYWPTTIWLAFTALIVLLIEPKQLLNISFALSFIAVMALLWTSRTKHTISLLNILYMQWVLSLVMGIATLLFIGNISFVSPIANLIIVPIYSLIIIPLSLLDASLIQLGINTTKPILYILENTIYITINILKYFNKFGNSFLFLGKANFVAGFLSLGLALWAFKQQKHRIFILFACIILMYPKYNKVETGTARYTALDVGQGQAIAIQTRHHTLIYDTGKRGRDKQVVQPFLLGEGRRAIDRLIISHDDNDHSGSAHGLIRNMKVHKTHLNRSCFDQWNWDGVQFELTRLKTYNNDNDASCILKVTPKIGHSLLITGDLSKQGEHRLLNNDSINLQADLMIAPHHGSKTSSSKAFLKAVNPDTVIYSSGFRNHFNHPHPDIVERYRKLGIQGYSTRCSGMIQIDADETGKIQLREYRKEQIWPWYRQCGDSEL